MHRLPEAGVDRIDRHGAVLVERRLLDLVHGNRVPGGAEGEHRQRDAEGGDHSHAPIVLQSREEILDAHQQPAALGVQMFLPAISVVVTWAPTLSRRS